MICRGRPYRHRRRFGCSRLVVAVRREAPRPIASRGRGLQRVLLLRAKLRVLLLRAKLRVLLLRAKLRVLLLRAKLRVSAAARQATRSAAADSLETVAWQSSGRRCIQARPDGWFMARATLGADSVLHWPCRAAEMPVNLVGSFRSISRSLPVLLLYVELARYAAPCCWYAGENR